MKKNYLILLFFFSVMTSIVAQTTLTGKVTDGGTGEELSSAKIIIIQKGNIVQSELTDIKGNYSIKVAPGEYELEVSYQGACKQLITDIHAHEDVTTRINLELFISCFICQPIVASLFRPLIYLDKTSEGIYLDSKEIEKLPTRDIREMSTFAPGVSFNQ